MATYLIPGQQHHNYERGKTILCPVLFTGKKSILYLDQLPLTPPGADLAQGFRLPDGGLALTYHQYVVSTRHGEPSIYERYIVNIVGQSLFVGEHPTGPRDDRVIAVVQRWVTLFRRLGHVSQAWIVKYCELEEQYAAEPEAGAAAVAVFENDGRAYRDRLLRKVSAEETI